MASLLLKNIQWNGKTTDIFIEGNRFAKIGADPDGNYDKIFNGAGKAIFPAFYNAHTHAAMTLFRGYADDLELFDWLNHYIWPAEAQLTRHDIYVGTLLAGVEMIRSGCVFFNDMYFQQSETIRAAEELGIRCCVGLIHLDNGSEKFARQLKAENDRIFAGIGRDYSSRITAALAPHAIYTVKEPELRALVEEAGQKHLGIHIHLAETQFEFDECVKAHQVTPTGYLNQLGMIGEHSYLAHSIYLTDEDRKILAEKQALLVHMPSSNMKLASGLFHYRANEAAGCRIAIGTDGCASNNNHSMLEEIKFAALNGKIQSMDPTAAKAQSVFDAATRVPAEAFVPGAGVIAEGKIADAMIIDLDSPQLVGNYNPISNLVYSADTSCVDSVLCDGKFVMENRVIPHEKEILAAARECCKKFQK